MTFHHILPNSYGIILANRYNLIEMPIIKRLNDGCRMRPHQKGIHTIIQIQSPYGLIIMRYNYLFIL